MLEPSQVAFRSRGHHGYQITAYPARAIRPLTQVNNDSDGQLSRATPQWASVASAAEHQLNINPPRKDNCQNTIHPVRAIPRTAKRNNQNKHHRTCASSEEPTARSSVIGSSWRTSAFSTSSKEPERGLSQLAQQNGTQVPLWTALAINNAPRGVFAAAQASRQTRAPAQCLHKEASGLARPGGSGLSRPRRAQWLLPPHGANRPRGRRPAAGRGQHDDERSEGTRNNKVPQSTTANHTQRPTTANARRDPADRPAQPQAQPAAEAQPAQHRRNSKHNSKNTPRNQPNPTQHSNKHNINTSTTRQRRRNNERTQAKPATNGKQHTATTTRKRRPRHDAGGGGAQFPNEPGRPPPPAPGQPRWGE